MCIHIHSTTTDVLHSISNLLVAIIQVNKEEKQKKKRKKKPEKRKRRNEGATTNVHNNYTGWLLGPPLQPQGQFHCLSRGRKCQ